MSQPKVSAEEKAQHIEELVEEWNLGEIRAALRKLTGWELFKLKLRLREELRKELYGKGKATKADA